MPKGFELFWRVQYYNKQGEWKTGIYLSEETARFIERLYKTTYGRKNVYLFAPKATA